MTIVEVTGNPHFPQFLKHSSHLGYFTQKKYPNFLQANFEYFGLFNSLERSKYVIKTAQAISLVFGQKSC